MSSGMGVRNLTFQSCWLGGVASLLLINSLFLDYFVLFCFLFVFPWLIFLVLGKRELCL